jgi:type VI secretion system secreted protein VgrG
MTTDHLSYELEVGGERYVARSVRGREAMSTLFRLEVVVTVAGTPPSARGLVNAEAQVHVGNPTSFGLTERSRTIRGIATEVKVVLAPGGATEMRVVVEPKMVLARYRSDLRIYRDKSVPVIVTEALSRIGVVPELRLSRSYADRAYCVQYRETDESFVRRLLEDEGIYFYFLDGRLIVGDDVGAYEPISGVSLIRFRDGSGLDDDEEAVIEIGGHAEVGPSRLTLRDWTTEHPSLDMDVGARGPDDSGPELYDYPGEYALPPEGSVRAQLIAESWARATSTIAGRSLSPRLGPGQTFTLVRSPEGSFDGETVVTAVEHDFRKSEVGYSNAFRALPAGQTFRPRRITPVPVITSPQTGIVTGPAGEDIHTDRLGRVKVHMHWDRQQPFDDRCSDWVPVLQENTGSSCAIPRIGWEVLVHFLEGDPDRPVVMGRTWNGEDELPFILPMNKTWTQMKSYSSPRSKTMADTGNNLIEFRDTAGLEEVTYQAERDQRINVANDKTTTVGNGEMATIDRDETWTVGGNLDVKTGQNHSTEVGGDQTITIGGNRKATSDLDDRITVAKNRVLTIGGMHFRKIADADSVSADHIVERVGGLILEASVGNNTARAEKNAKVTVGGAVIEVAGGNKTTTTEWGRVETVGGLVYAKAKEEMTLGAGKMRRTMVGGMMKITSGKRIAIGAKQSVKISSPIEKLSGSKEITLKVGETEVVIKEGQLRIKTAKEISIDVGGVGTLHADDSIQI